MLPKCLHLWATKKEAYRERSSPLPWQAPECGMFPFAQGYKMFAERRTKSHDPPTPRSFPDCEVFLSSLEITSEDVTQQPQMRISFQHALQNTRFSAHPYFAIHICTHPVLALWGLEIFYPKLWMHTVYRKKTHIGYGYFFFFKVRLSWGPETLNTWGKGPKGSEHLERRCPNLHQPSEPISWEFRGFK